MKRLVLPAAPPLPRYRSDVVVLALGPRPDGLPGDVEVLAVNPSRGLAAALNRGLEATRTRYACVMAGSAVADLDELLRFMEAHPEAGAVGAGPGIRQADFVDGSCLLIRRSLLERIGPFDEAYFAFFEDLDLCRRIRRAGATVWAHPAAKASPRVAADLRERVEAARSWATYCRKHCAGGLALQGLLHPLRTLLALGPRSWGLAAAAEPRFVKLRDGWTVEESHLESFADFDRVVEKGRKVKEAKYKRTVEVESAGRTYLVKTEGRGRLFRTIRYAVIGSKARREARVSLAVRRSGIPCVPVVAWGDRSYGSAAVVEKLPGARSLLEVFLDAALPLRERRRLLRSYGRFSRRLHDAGVDQYDFSPANVLLSEGRMLLIDFEWTRCTGRPVPERRRLRSIVKVARLGRVSRTDQLRFMKGYLDAHASEGACMAGLFSELRRRAAKQLNADLARSEVRCLEENRDFRAFKRDGLEGHCRRIRQDRPDPGLDDAGLSRALEAGSAYRLEEVPDALEAWKRANRGALGGGLRPLAVVRRRGEKAGRLVWPRNSEAPGGVEQA